MEMLAFDAGKVAKKSGKMDFMKMVKKERL